MTDPNTSPHAGTVVLLGPQSDFSEIRDVLDELDIGGSVALITTGWQENELEDEGIVARIARSTTNLALHARSESFYASDPAFADAARARQVRLRRMQHFYRVRLDAVDDAARSVAVGHVDPELDEEQLAITISQLQHLDNDHITRCRALWRRFESDWPAREHPELQRHREEIAGVLSACDALVISGGHVGSLINRLRLFDVFGHIPPIPIVAWSGGAMVLTDRVVLFHDAPPFGKNLAQLLDYGLGLAPGIVVMPDIQHRVRTDDVAGIARYAARMAPKECLGLDPGSRLVFENGELVRGSADLLTMDGRVVGGWSP